MLDRRRHNAGERHFPLTGMERQVNAVMFSRVEQPISHAQQDTGIQNESLLPGKKSFLLIPGQRSGYEDQQDHDGERKKEQIGPEKESHEKGNNAGENYIRKTPC